MNDIAHWTIYEPPDATQEALVWRGIGPPSVNEGWRRIEVVPSSNYLGAVSDRDALVHQLRCAVGAITGEPWRGWTVTDAQHLLDLIDGGR